MVSFHGLRQMKPWDTAVYNKALPYDVVMGYVAGKLRNL